MRLFDFECLHCGAHFEELVRNGETGESVRCPECGEVGARRQLNGFAVGRSSGGGASFSSASRGCGSGGFS